jgi:homoserine dehydrogenase
LLGVGNVGSGTFNVLQRNQEEIRRRAGRGIEVVAVSAAIWSAPRRTGGKVKWWPTRSTSSTIRKSISSSS